ncbi:MAG: DMT family transporter [Cyclobacteriaceae bacterium]
MNFKNLRWLIFSILAALCWGIWGVMAKIISEDISPYMNHILFTIGMLLTIPFVLKNAQQKPLNRKGIFWGVIAGFLAVAGNIAIYRAFATGGLAAIVIPVSNLYPVVTIAIAIIVLKEKLHWLNGVGVLLAIFAIVILSGETLLLNDPKSFFESMTLNTWLLSTLVALLFWGFFSAAQKITTNHISAKRAYIIFVVSSVSISLAFVVLGEADWQISQRTTFLGSVAGMLNGLGVLASFAAYSAEGKASKVTTIAGALQPVFTILLAIFLLGENLSFLEVGGIAIAIVAALMLSYERPPKVISNILIKNA